jgi:hypothetical protein
LRAYNLLVGGPMANMVRPMPGGAQRWMQLKHSAPLLLEAFFTVTALACSGTQVSNTSRDGGGAAGSGATSSGGSGAASSGGSDATSSGGSGGRGASAAGGGSSGGSRASGGGAGTGGIETCLICAGGRESAGGASGSSGSSAGGTGGLGSGGTRNDDAGVTGQVSCAGAGPHTFPRFVEACLRDADCILVHRQTDCCGSLSNLAINNGEAAAFAAAEAMCEAQYPACECAAHAPPAATVACVNTRCQVIGSGGNGACGGACSSGQYCSVQAPGTGGMTSRGCVTDPDCASDCIYCDTHPPCTCSGTSGQIEVRCFGQ